MKFMLDSNVIIAVALATNEALRKRMSMHDEGDFAISTISYAEVIHGSVNEKPPELNRLHVLTEEMPVLPFDMAAARTYASIPFRRASYDRLIAAHALSLGLTVVTENIKRFADVPGLKVENWLV